jgi:flagellar basal body-associated protein FliL
MTMAQPPQGEAPPPPEQPPAAPGFEFPPVGAYPGEPGHPDPAPVPDSPAQPDQPTEQSTAPLAGPEQPTTQLPPPLPPPPGQFGQPGQFPQPGQFAPAADPYAPPAAEPYGPPTGPGEWSAQAAPGAQPWLVSPGAPAPKRRRTVLWVTLALVITVLLCGGGGVSAFLLLRNAENGKGAPDPSTAVTRFMTAVYTDQDASAATALVCREARDAKKISAKVDEVKGYAKQYDTPKFAWESPTVDSEQEDRALVTVALTMTTDDEKTAKQQLTFTVVKKTGWWVCEVAG